MGFKNNKKKAEELNLRQIISLMSFRKPKDIIFNKGKGARRPTCCPTCHIPIDVEFINYCTHCGQHLKWRKYYKQIEAEECLQCEISKTYCSRTKSYIKQDLKRIKGLIRGYK